MLKPPDEEVQLPSAVKIQVLPGSQIIPLVNITLMFCGIMTIIIGHLLCSKIIPINISAVESQSMFVTAVMKKHQEFANRSKLLQTVHLAARSLHAWSRLCQSASVAGAFYGPFPPAGTLEDLKKCKDIELKVA